MVCDKCGSALPSEGYICKECGAMMNKSQIDSNKKNKNKEYKKTYLSDHFGVKKNIEYRKKDKSYIYAYVIIFVFLMALAVILYLLR